MLLVWMESPVIMVRMESSNINGLKCRHDGYQSLDHKGVLSIYQTTLGVIPLMIHVPFHTNICRATRRARLTRYIRLHTRILPNCMTITSEPVSLLNMFRWQARFRR